MVGIIVAMQEELEAIKKYMNNVKEKNIYSNIIYNGNIGKTECIMTVCGIGKVNAARITQVLIDNFKLDYIINVGVAGAINNKLKIGDIVIGEKLVQYDFDLTAFGRKKGEISDDIGTYIYCDKFLVQNAENMLTKKKDINIIRGTIASGDRFVTQRSLSNEIRKEFDADCVEMEGASIAQVCFLDNIPFIVIRSISDSPNEKNMIDHELFLTKTAQNAADFVKIFIDTL